MKKMKMAALAAGALIMSAVPATMAQAATLVIDVAGIESIDGFGEPTNNVFEYAIGAGSIITGIAYDVNVTAFDPSYLSEIVVSFTGSDTAGDGVFLTPGFLDSFSGTASYAGSADLTDPAINLAFAVGADGILRVEFFEDFDDFVGADGIFNSGTITLTYDIVGGPAVPEPAAWALMIGGFGAVGGAMRRRSKTTVAVTYA